MMEQMVCLLTEVTILQLILLYYSLALDKQPLTVKPGQEILYLPTAMEQLNKNLIHPVM